MSAIPQPTVTDNADGLSWDLFRAGLAKWADEQGWPYGCPIPSLSETVTARLVVAPRAPFHKRGLFPTLAELSGKVKPSIHVCHEDDMFVIRNQWFSERTGLMISIIQYEDGRIKLVKETEAYRYSERFRLLMETGPTRLGAVTVVAEFKAMTNLLSRLNETQKHSYILNGHFAETSKRSGVSYFLRKGYPTLALRKTENGIKFLAALCLHPLAYYQGTFAGSMAPSDDVLAHLLMIRGDERRFWAKSIQHVLWDVRSGI